MKRYLIRGGRPMRGTVRVSGFKNAALPILYATILTGDVYTVRNLPHIRDVLMTLEILHRMGASVTFLDRETVKLDTRFLVPRRPPDDCVRALRASSYLLGACLARFGRVSMTLPGGCQIGSRPFDLHRLALTALGADWRQEETTLAVTAHRLTGGEIAFPTSSVGATVNALLAATAADGLTVIRNASREPHIGALCSFLRQMGADIEEERGCLRVYGGLPLHGADVTVMPDMIEAGTFLAALGAVGGSVFLSGAEASPLSPVIEAYTRMGLEIREETGGLAASRQGPLRPIALEASPHPGFPTDMHPETAAMACFAGGVSTIRDRVFPDRFAYLEPLRQMGADVRREGDTVTVTPAPLHPARVTVTDLRGGAAAVLAALGTEGESEIFGVELIGRGYDRLAPKLTSLGLSIEEV